MRTSPAASVPTIAPIVFAAYSRPNARLSALVRVEVAGQAREGRAHQDGRRGQREDRQDEPDEREQRRASPRGTGRCRDRPRGSAGT